MISSFKDEWFFRVIIFIVVAIGLFIFEKGFPQFKTGSLKRKVINFSFHFINILTVRLILPGAVFSIAVLSEKTSSGILRSFSLDNIILTIITILVLEWVVYVQHVLFHKIPFLWNLHKIHHSDTTIDFTTALRFHPLEILISIVFKGVVIFFLGLPAIGVIIFEIFLNSMAMFNHANIRLPKRLEVLLRMFVVTPQMHRVHHSQNKDDHHKNFSFGLSFWDRLFKTYKVPQSSQNGLSFGTGDRNWDGQEDIIKLLLVK